MLNLNENKKYFLLYSLIVVFFTLSFFNYEDYNSFSAFIFIFALLLGFVSLIYYSKNKNKLEHVAFIIILLFGVTSVFLTPINDVSDELEHLTRADIISTGEISTTYVPMPDVDDNGYKTIKSIDDLQAVAGSNVFNTDVDDKKIDYTPAYLNSAFSQNPFYAYLAQGLGIFVAKLLDLNCIWMLWLARLFNILLYGSIISLAIRKTPIFKFPMLIISLLPLAIYQAASVSVDGLFSALGILAIAYFFYLHENKVEWKDLGIFYLSVVLCGLLKSPYLALSLLIFLVPQDNFTNKKQNLISKIAILIVLAIGTLWSSYATSVLANSWRGEYYSLHNVNATAQINYLLAHPYFSLERFFNLFGEFHYVIGKFFTFSIATQGDYSSSLMNILYIVFIMLFSIIYPIENKFNIKDRFKTLLICFLIYCGVIGVQYLTWASVGDATLMHGIFSRYFMPLLIFLPFLFGGYYNQLDKEKIAKLSLTIAIGFIAGMFMLTVSFKY